MYLPVLLLFVHPVLITWKAFHLISILSIQLKFYFFLRLTYIPCFLFLVPTKCGFFSWGISYNEGYLRWIIMATISSKRSWDIRVILSTYYVSHLLSGNWFHLYLAYFVLPHFRYSSDAFWFSSAEPILLISTLNSLSLMDFAYFKDFHSSSVYVNFPTW